MSSSTKESTRRVLECHAYDNRRQMTDKVLTVVPCVLCMFPLRKMLMCVIHPMFLKSNNERVKSHKQKTFELEWIINPFCLTIGSQLNLSEE